MTVPLPVIANTFRCALKWTESASGQTAVNVIHIKAQTGTPIASDAYSALNSSVTAAMWDSVVATASVGEVDITPLDGVSGTQSFTTGSPAKWTGSAGGDFIPAVAALIKLTTALRGRNRRGRVFLPFTAEAAQANGLLTSAVVSAVSPAWTAFQASLVGITAFDWDLGVASYDRAHSGAGAGFQSISSVTCERPTANQRRRQERLR